MLKWEIAYKFQIQLFAKDDIVFSKVTNIITDLNLILPVIGLSIKKMHSLSQVPSLLVRFFTIKIDTLQLIYTLGLKGGGCLCSKKKETGSDNLDKKTKDIDSSGENQTHAFELATVIRKKIKSGAFLVSDLTPLLEINPYSCKLPYAIARELINSLNDTNIWIERDESSTFRQRLSTVIRKFLVVNLVKSENRDNIDEEERKSYIKLMADVVTKSERKRQILEPLLLIEVATIQKLVGSSNYAYRWRDFIFAQFKEIVHLCVAVYTGNVSEIIKSVGKAIELAIDFSKQKKIESSELTFMLIFDKFENTLISEKNESDKIIIGNFVENLLQKMDNLSPNQQIISLEFITNCIIKDVAPTSVLKFFFRKLKDKCIHNALTIRAQSAQILRLMRNSLRKAERIHMKMKNNEKDSSVLAILELEPIKIKIAGDELEKTKITEKKN